MSPTDAPTLALLETQLRELSAVLDTLAWAAGALVPAKATFWEGRARESYDRAVLRLDEGLVSTRDILALARQNTELAISEVMARG